MTRFCLALAIWLAMPSCHPPVKDSPSLDQVRAIQNYDGWNFPDSAIQIIEGLNFNSAYEGAFSVKLIYCRSLFLTQRNQEADRLYRLFISRSESVNEKWRFYSEYLLMLWELNEFDKMMQYSDSIVICCADSMQSFRDMRALYHFRASQGKGDCDAMKIWIDSMDYWSPRMLHPVVDSAEIANYRSEFDSLCQTPL